MVGKETLLPRGEPKVTVPLVGVWSAETYRAMGAVDLEAHGVAVTVLAGTPGTHIYDGEDYRLDDKEVLLQIERQGHLRKFWAEVARVRERLDPQP